MAWVVGMETKTISAVARLAGIIVRTLRHYDDIGLLCPSERSDNGYRKYTDVDIGRLQQTLTYREVAFGLDEIRAILDESVDTVLASQSARDRIRKRIVKLDSICNEFGGRDRIRNERNCDESTRQVGSFRRLRS